MDKQPRLNLERSYAFKFENIIKFRNQERYLLFFILFSLSIYLITSYIQLYNEYGELIQWLKSMKSKTAYQELNPFWIGLSLYFPIFANFYANKNLPLAIQLSFYDKQIRPYTMGYKYDYINDMYIISIRQDTLSAKDIICSAYSKYIDRKLCLPKCTKVPGNVSSASSYIASISGGVGSVGGLGGMILGAPGAIIGSVIGGFVGLFQAEERRKRRERLCSEIRKNCYLPPNKKFDC